jgi:hypothetical protein
MAAEPHPRLGPLTLADVLDQTFAIYRRGFRTFLGIAALVQVPVALVTLPLATTSTGYFEQVSRGATDGLALLSAFGGPILVLGALAVILNLIAWVVEIAAVCWATAESYQGGQPRLEAAMRWARQRFWPLLRLLVVYGLTFVGLWLLAVAPVLLPALLCISLPAVFVAASYLLVAWSLAPCALALEERPSVSRALGRSRALVRGAFWRTLAALALLSVLVGVLQLSGSILVQVIGALLQALAAPDAPSQPLWVTISVSLLSNLLGILVRPPFYIGLTLLYYDRRIRREGYDLAVQADALAPSPDALAPRAAADAG